MAERVSVIKRNLAANFVGTAWSGLLMVAMVPVYVRFLGLEAYGVVVFYTAVQSVVVLLDLGLATAVNREVARLSVSEANRERMRALVQTAEVAFWLGAALLSAVLFVAAPMIATRWLGLHELPPSEATLALRFMAVALGLRFPYNLYAGALLGLQRHVALNAVLTAATTFRLGGTVAVLLLIAPDVRVVLAWEVVAAVVQTLAAAAVLRKRLPAAAGRFDASLLSHTWVFARGAATIGALAAVAMQIDKFTVSRLLPLETFGRYGVAVTMAVAVMMIVNPVQATVFPRFSQLVAAGASSDLTIAYHRASQTVSALIVPAALMAIVFSRELVTLWTGDAALAGQIRPLVILLVAGALFNGLLSVPYVLQLAYGWTSLAMGINAVSVALMIPLTIAAVQRFGAPGAAAAWMFMHGFQLLAGLVMTHRRLLPGHLARWAWQDLGVPAAVAFAVCVVGRAVISDGSRLQMLVSMALTGTIAFAVAALSTPVVRERWTAARVGGEPD